MLKTAFEHLNLNLGEIDQPTLNELAEDARIVTGGNPRSIKRIINTLSLLQHIPKAKAVKMGEKAQDARLNLLEARFIIVSMYINYPEICRRLMKNPNFTEWNPERLNLKWKLRLEENKPQLEALSGEEWCNDPWEKTVYCICSQSEWLKSQARNVSMLLNKLLKVLDPENEPDKPLSEKSQELLQSLLESIRVVSIDLDQHEVIVVDDSKVKEDRVSKFDQALQTELAERLPNLVPAWTNEYAKKKESRNYETHLMRDKGRIAFDYYKTDEEFYITIGLPKNNPAVKKTKKFLEDYLATFGENFASDADKDEFSIWDEEASVISWDDFLKGNQINMELVKEQADKAVKLLEIAQKAQKELNKLS